jgi:hypothetical protein
MKYSYTTKSLAPGWGLFLIIDLSGQKLLNLGYNHSFRCYSQDTVNA